jgi:hypothetical protein
MENLNEKYKAERERYMNNEISHQEFYTWLADEIHISDRRLPFTLEQIKASTDPHLNDLPLAKWDACDAWVRHQAASYGMKAWSLSDTVCVLKAVARRAAEKELTRD